MITISYINSVISLCYLLFFLCQVSRETSSFTPAAIRIHPRAAKELSPIRQITSSYRHQDSHPSIVAPHQHNRISTLFVSPDAPDDDERIIFTEDEILRNPHVDVFLKASRSSFKFVEKSTFHVFANQPLVAFAIFVGLGLLTAYVSGFVFLGGYIESPSPLTNGEIPYWEDITSARLRI